MRDERRLAGELFERLQTSMKQNVNQNLKFYDFIRIQAKSNRWGFVLK